MRPDVPSEALNLTVLVVNDGFSLKASGGNVAPGCQGIGAGIAIPKKGGKYDYDALTECAARLKNANPEFRDENQAYINAQPGHRLSDRHRRDRRAAHERSRGAAVRQRELQGDPMSASVVRYKAELRKAIRRNAAEPEINFLNITAMLDIMTIILVFLLNTPGESSAAVPQSDDLRLPNSIVTTQLHQEGVTVTISKSQILVGDAKVLNLSGRESLVQTGAGALNKRGELFIVPLGSALQAARKTRRRGASGQGSRSPSSEAIIIADMTTPYRLLIEVLFTLGQSEFGKYHLMVMQTKKKG